MERVELAVDEDGERRKGPVGDVGRVAGAVSLEAIAVGAGRVSLPSQTVERGIERSAAGHMARGNCLAVHSVV
jgi:hypothetical protein